MKTRLLLVEDDNKVSKDIISYFKNDNEISLLAVAEDGESAIKYISNEIDVILLDYVMPNKDGYGLLKYLESNDFKNKIILMTGYKIKSMINLINFDFINYIVQKPINLDDIKDVILKINTVKENRNYEIKVTEILTKLGMSASMEGFYYTREAILYLLNDNKNYTINEIYIKIAKEFNTTKYKVERDIRHAIFISWLKADEELSYKIFGNIVSVNKANPTNSEYIYTIVDKIKIGMI